MKSVGDVASQQQDKDAPVIMADGNLSALHIVDLSDFEVADTQMIQIKDAKNDPIPGFFVEIYGPATYICRAALNELRKAEESTGKDVSVDASDMNMANYLTAITKSFAANIKYKGLSGKELFHAVYMERRLGFIRNQVNSAVFEWSKYVKK